MSEPEARAAPVRTEFVRYAIISGGGFALDFVVLAFCVEALDLPLLAANTISFSFGVVAVYLGSIYWAFEERRLDDAKTEFAIFAVIGVVGLIVNQVALWAAVTTLGVPYLMGKVGAAGASFVANFALRKAALFR